MISALYITNNTLDQAVYIGKFRGTSVHQTSTNMNPYIMQANSSCSSFMSFADVDCSPLYY